MTERKKNVSFIVIDSVDLQNIDENGDEIKNTINEQEQKITKYKRALQRNEERRNINEKRIEEEAMKKRAYIPSVAYPKNFVRELSPPRQVKINSRYPIVPTYCRCGYLSKNDDMKQHLQSQEHIDKMKAKKQPAPKNSKYKYVPALVKPVARVQCGVCRKMFSRDMISAHLKEFHGDYDALDENNTNNYKCGCGAIIKKASMNSHFNTETHKSFMVKYRYLQEQLKREKKIV